MRDAQITKLDADEIVSEMVRRIVEGFHPEMIVLFGSYVRGDSNVDSDVDLLVVAPVTGSKRDLTISIRKELAGIGVAEDIIVVTPQELARYRDVVGTVVYPAMHEGTVVYERGA